MSTTGVTSALLRRKKVWIVGAMKILGLPSSLILRMTPPLTLIESNHPLPHDSILLTQKFHWMLWILQVGIERRDTVNNDIDGWLQTFFLAERHGTCCANSPRMEVAPIGIPHYPT
jgi:hypothetical protein